MINVFLYPRQIFAPCEFNGPHLLSQPPFTCSLYLINGKWSFIICGAASFFANGFIFTRFACNGNRQGLTLQACLQFIPNWFLYVPDLFSIVNIKWQSVVLVAKNFFQADLFRLQKKVSKKQRGSSQKLQTSGNSGRAPASRPAGAAGEDGARNYPEQTGKVSLNKKWI